MLSKGVLNFVVVVNLMLELSEKWACQEMISVSLFANFWVSQQVSQEQ